MLGILVFALALRLYHLDHQNLWLDETLTWWDARLPTYWLLRRSALNVHPPGTFLMVKLWTHLFGSTPAMLRLPFLLSSLLVIWLAFVLARSILSTPIALLAAAVLALSPHQIYFAQEARMYALVTALTLGATICYLRLRQKAPARWRYRVGFALLFVAALHTHYFAALMLAAVNAHFFFHDVRPGRSPQSMTVREWIGLNASVLLAVVPWTTFVLLHPGIGVGQDWRPPLSLIGGIKELRDLFSQMTVGYNVYPWELITALVNYRRYPEAADARAFFIHRFLIFGLGVPAMIACFLRGLWLLRRRGEVILWLCFVPLGMLVLGMMMIRRGMELSRYLMIISPYFAIMLAAGTVSLNPVKWRLLVGGTVMVAMGLALSTYYRTPTRGSDYRPVAQLIRRHYEPGDVIIADPFYMDRPLFYYLSDPRLWRAIIHTTYLDDFTEYLRVRARLPRVWVVLDHRSDLFDVPAERFERLWPTYSIVLDVMFPERFPKVRVLSLASTGWKPSFRAESRPASEEGESNSSENVKRRHHLGPPGDRGRRHAHAGSPDAGNRLSVQRTNVGSESSDALSGRHRRYRGRFRRPDHDLALSGRHRRSPTRPPPHSVTSPGIPPRGEPTAALLL